MSTIINATTTNGVVIQPDNSGSLVLQTNSGTTAVTIDTSQRAAFVAGTAALPAITTTGDTNTGMWFPAADTIAASTGGTERMRITSTGNVGIGVTPSASSATALQVGARGIFYQGGDAGPVLANNLFNDGSNKYITTGFATAYQQNAAGLHIWYTAPSGTGGTGASLTETMRIDSSGNLLVGTTTVTGSARQTIAFTSSSGGTGISYIDSQANNTATFAGFYSNVTKIGSITNNGNSATAYNTSSDYRLKENIVPMTGALATISALKPVTYKWKATGDNGQGFIAHELQAVVPDCVTGEKDAVDADGNPDYQGVDTSFLVATLTAAIQEQQTIINDLKARVETLEAK